MPTAGLFSTCFRHLSSLPKLVELDTLSSLLYLKKNGVFSHDPCHERWQAKSRMQEMMQSDAGRQQNGLLLTLHDEVM
ncbi:hypothetical protein H8L32_19650 [Undibacterium sp. CY18W]|uniref:Uncharacterized protein n=1 Tax=Undibacterium hunanense TaxID=2762292 RepID=A0ABR6ZV04_9BURK|nr:hypothetical protein [Undibacterium hunanense]